MAEGYGSGCVEESRPDFADSEVLFESAFSEVPLEHLYGLVGFVIEVDLVHTKIGPIISLGDIGLVMIITDVVLVTKIVCWVYEKFLSQ